MDNKSVLHFWILLVIIPIQLVGTSLSEAHINYTVKVVTKDNSHPLFGQGSSVGYTMNGVQGVELKMVRGIQYNFHMDRVAAEHPFYITASSTGGQLGINAVSEGVTGNFSIEDAT